MAVDRFDPDAVKLGKLDKVEDPRTLMFAKYLPKKITPPLVPAAQVQRMDQVAEWPMYENDRIGDCTCVGCGYSIILDSTIARGEVVMPSEADIVGLYNATGEGDTGRACLDVLKFWQQNGLAGQKLLAFCEINPQNTDHVKLAMQLFGQVYAGVALPTDAQAQVEQGCWTVTRGPGAEPGSWGGHCIMLGDYTTRGGPVCATWTREQRMTWAWWNTYADEAYCLITEDWFDANGNAPGGFKMDALLKDLAEIQG